MCRARGGGSEFRDQPAGIGVSSSAHHEVVWICMHAHAMCMNKQGTVWL